VAAVDCGGAGGRDGYSGRTGEGLGDRSAGFARHFLLPQRSSGLLVDPHRQFRRGKFKTGLNAVANALDAADTWLQNRIADFGDWCYEHDEDLLALQVSAQASGTPFDDLGVLMGRALNTLGAGFRYMRPVARGLQTAEKFFGNKTMQQAEKAMSQSTKYELKYSVPGKNAYFNKETTRSIVIHNQPELGHGPPHIDITSRTYDNVRKIPLKE
jgi:hypothetical protein